MLNFKNMLKQKINQSLKQKLSPQQIQLMKLIQLPNIELLERIKNEVEENPAIEDISFDNFDTPDKNQQSGDRNDDFSDYNNINDSFNFNQKFNKEGNNYSTPIQYETSTIDSLEKQLSIRDLDYKFHQIGSYLIGCVNNNGYILRDINSIVEDLFFKKNIQTTENEVLEVLKIIHNFEPYGIGARNLKECIEIQLNKKKSDKIIEISKKIIKNYFNELSKKHYQKLMDELNIDEETLKSAIGEILKLNPKPGNLNNNKLVQHIIPDFSLKVEDGKLDLSINNSFIPELKINKKFREILESSNEKNKELIYVKNKLDSAKLFISSLQERNSTLFNTLNSIVNFQKEYFMTGDENKLKPMILKNIADDVKLDISTISRVANSKYIETPYGIFLVKYFFSESQSKSDGSNVSNREVKNLIIDMIKTENKVKPLTDTEIMKQLNTKGYNIARRTVSKYRENLKIPIARLRREII